MYMYLINYGQGLLRQLNFEPQNLLHRNKVSCRQACCRQVTGLDLNAVPAPKSLEAYLPCHWPLSSSLLFTFVRLHKAAACM